MAGTGVVLAMAILVMGTATLVMGTVTPVMAMATPAMGTQLLAMAMAHLPGATAAILMQHQPLRHLQRNQRSKVPFLRSGNAPARVFLDEF